MDTRIVAGGAPPPPPPPPGTVRVKRCGGSQVRAEGGGERLDGRLASVAVVADSLPLWLSSKGPGPGSGTRSMFEHAIKPDTAEPDSRHRDDNCRKGTHYVHTYNRGMGRGVVCVLTDR